MNFEIPMALIVVWLAFVVVIIAAWWKIFEKAGQPGWASLIPFYNLWIIVKIGGKPSSWFWFCFIPFAGIVFAIWNMNMLVKSFGKDEGFTAGMLFLGIIFVPILGFGSAKYLGPFANKAAFDAHNLKDFGKPGNDQ